MDLDFRINIILSYLIPADNFQIINFESIPFLFFNLPSPCVLHFKLLIIQSSFTLFLFSHSTSFPFCLCPYCLNLFIHFSLEQQVCSVLDPTFCLTLFLCFFCTLHTSYSLKDVSSSDCATATSSCSMQKNKQKNRDCDIIILKRIMVTFYDYVRVNYDKLLKNNGRYTIWT